MRRVAEAANDVTGVDYDFVVVTRLDLRGIENRVQRLVQPLQLVTRDMVVLERAVDGIPAAQRGGNRPAWDRRVGAESGGRQRAIPTLQPQRSE